MNTSAANSGISMQKRDPDMVGSEAAMKRAALRAREIARKHGTAIVTKKDGKIVKEYPK